ncbi:Starch-binding associating with outer membrane [Filimonas lacunae]|uniref:Starch-binding associating with outer membrane n=1 Tax=Filimonas lacunae TaxID=477680 RepID=A0A173MKA4_9BACT|nr:RagB/SusD family nutrient uptake outer membrane protein [Filimonas lacunae]BAV07828.1 outer membrane protein SusD [Filimonas lacunae]SIT05310.1 Starch-binding associating with outer membrane [Filimonas lacunae]
MNKKYMFVTGLALFAAGACTKLDVPLQSQTTVIPNTAEAYVAATGSVYQKLSSSSFGVDVWRMQELSTDEAIIPNRNGSYYDNGAYIKLHKHTWTSSDVAAAWTWAYSAISEANRILNVLEAQATSALTTTSIAEVRTMRALYYFYMMDLYGSVPITKFGTTENPKQSTRTEVFNFIESELLKAVPDLASPATVTIQYYGRPTKWAAYALLQKIYLNAEYYTGTARYTDAITYGNKIVNESGLSLAGSYMSLFSPTNTANSETILAAVFDANRGQGNMLTRYTLHGKLQAKYGLNFAPSNAMCTTPEFLDLFNLSGDARDTTWVSGLQYDFAGKAIMADNTNQLKLTREIVLTDASSMNVGPEINGVSCGARSVKFYPDPNAVNRNQNNDIPILRLADVYLMQAEAILRSNGDAATAVSFFNKVRARAKAPQVNSITLNDILDERGRELAWECWRRNDLIRFGKWEGAWGFKTGNESINLRIFPIPATEMVLNPNLVQNPGYN